MSNEEQKPTNSPDLQVGDNGASQVQDKTLTFKASGQQDVKYEESMTEALEFRLH